MGSWRAGIWEKEGAKGVSVGVSVWQGAVPEGLLARLGGIGNKAGWAVLLLVLARHSPGEALG